ncbi:MAG: anion permease [Gammaproteobacteria bacterium]|nr:anion permease [Gammaproteobacteria bacterium]MBT8151247.1 anion permease [Gammaproteobacteria bacterium]NNL10817.1 SLC13 family permease [Pseudomonadales bacterium]RZV55806.1 MAG: SLC13 family permease [Pseudomonadales bacterium]
MNFSIYLQEYYPLIAIGVVLLCFVGLMRSRLPPDAVLMAGVAILLLVGVLEPFEAFAGFANEGTITVALLFVVARGLTKTGAASWVAGSLLGKPSSLPKAQFRLMAPVAVLSSVVNNTPVVAMMIPAVIDWAKRFKFAPSQLLIPLSYAAIMGGACTLIGTSTNLVVDGLLKTHYLNATGDGDHGLALFELAWVGLPCVLVTLLYLLLFGRKLLPVRGGAANGQFGDTRQYTVEMLIEDDSPLIGATVEAAGLRNLPGMYLIEIQREGHLITAVGPAQELKASDRLVFVGNVESVVDLQKIRGLRPAEDQIFKLDSERSQRHLVEVVLSNSFPGLFKTVKEGQFRSTYGAAIIAIARQGQRLKGRVGDVVLKPGDTLLIEAGRSFERQQRYVRDFLLVRKIDEYTPVSYQHMKTSLLVFGFMIVLAATGALSMVKAALLAVGALLVLGCLRVEEARRSVDWQILIVIGASIALGTALEKTGAAQSIAHNFVALVGDSPHALLAALFILTAGFSAMISNVSAAVLIFPVASAASQQLGVDLTPFAVTLMIAASASFATPIGYQTNLMVYGPGEYRFMDFVKIGTPLTLLVGITTVLMVPMIWPF